MKKIIIFLLPLLFSLQIKADDTEQTKELGQIIIHLLVQETGGYSLEYNINEARFYADIKVPSIYDNEKIILKLNPLFKKADFTTLLPWGIQNDGFLRTMQAIEGIPILFNYDEKNHILSFVILRENIINK